LPYFFMSNTRLIYLKTQVIKLCIQSKILIFRVTAALTLIIGQDCIGKLVYNFIIPLK